MSIGQINLLDEIIVDNFAGGGVKRLIVWR